jgi:hypothetical protein
MVADCWVFVDIGKFYLQSNTARIVPSTLTINGMSHYSGPTSYVLGGYWLKAEADLHHRKQFQLGLKKLGEVTPSNAWEAIVEETTDQLDP